VTEVATLLSRLFLDEAMMNIIDSRLKQARDKLTVGD